MQNEESARISIGKNGQGEEKNVVRIGTESTVTSITGGKKNPVAKTSTPEYRVWSDIKQRCMNPNNKNFHNYGGRGISICDRWLYSFETFLQDMGERPAGMSIDRFPNNNGNYEPGNCRWATQQQQAENTRLVLNICGTTQSQHARNLGSSQGCVYHRRKHGLPVDAPVHQLRKGQWHHNAGLTEEQVIYCRQEYDKSDKRRGFVAQLARSISASRDAVYLAVRRVTWKHLP